MQKKLAPAKKSNKWSLKEFVWFGFNFVFGGTFSASFASYANMQNGNNGLGLYTLLTWFVVGVFAFVCAKSFAKLSRYHNSNQNGAAYVYARTTFGRLTGLFTGFLQYCYLPFSLTYQIMGFIRGNFTSPFIGTTSKVYQCWGPFNDLWMDLIAIGLFIGCSLIIHLGMKWFKKISFATIIGKWVSLFFVVACSLWIILSKDTSSNNLNGTNCLDYWSKHSTFTLSLFIKNFNACFFAFVGFELVVGAGKNIENPNKNISKGLFWIIILSISCYVLFSFLYLCATQTITENYNVDVWTNAEKILPKWTVMFGVILVMVNLIFMRVYVFMHKSLYGGTTLQPLAIEGYFPDKFGKLNKDGLPISASTLNLIVVTSISLIWLIVPDIVKGSLIKSGHFDQSEVFFNMGAFSSFASLIAIAIYIIVLLAAINLLFAKKIKSNRIIKDYLENIMYIVTTLVLVLVVIYHYYNLIDLVINNHNNDQTSIKAVTGLSIELFSTIAIVAFFFIWYKSYYAKKITTRTVSKQKQLDAPFKLLNEREIN